MARSRKIRGRQLAYKKRLISRKIKRRKITVITRRTQPAQAQDREVMIQALKKQDIYPKAVSSSWIAKLGYNAKRRTVIMDLISGHSYHILGVPFKVFEEWIAAHSKGTFWHVKNIRDNYKVMKVR